MGGLHGRHANENHSHRGGAAVPNGVDANASHSHFGAATPTPAVPPIVTGGLKGSGLSLYVIP